MGKLSLLAIQLPQVPLSALRAVEAFHPSSGRSLDSARIDNRSYPAPRAVQTTSMPAPSSPNDRMVRSIVENRAFLKLRPAPQTNRGGVDLGGSTRIGVVHFRGQHRGGGREALPRDATLHVFPF
jgi:hypothetical protein